jgi:HlyD family secretion protein
LVKRLASYKFIGFVLAAILLATAARWAYTGDYFRVDQLPESQGATDAPAADPAPQSKIRVDVVRPHVGSMARSDTEPGNVDAFDYANLYSKVSGYLKVQNVDIGSKVKQGQILAEIDAPEYVQARDQAKAEVEQARSKLDLTKAAVVRAQADVVAAEAEVAEKQAELKRAKAALEFRETQFVRISQLYELKSVDQRLVAERRKERDASRAEVDATEASIRTARAVVDAKKARVEQAQADIVNAQAKLDVAATLLQKAQVYVDYLKIVAPFDGVITHRGYHVGEFVRTPDSGKRQSPLLTVARTDVMRVVTMLPERYVPYCDPGDPAQVELDALHGRVFHAKVSRISESLDQTDGMMRVEVDLKNPNNELRDGMVGRVTIQLTSATKELSIPSSALVSNHAAGSFSVYVVRQGRAELTPIKIGRDNGILAEVLTGIQPNDLIVAHPTEDLHQGAPVEVDEVAPTKGSAAASTKK